MKSEILVETDKMKSRRITLSPGESVGKHNTNSREEIIIIMKGTATITKNADVLEIKQGSVIHLPENTEHDVRNNSDKELEYVYVVLAV